MSTANPGLTLVLGGSGFLGRHVVRAALDDAAAHARRTRRRRAFVVSASREPERALVQPEAGLLTAAFDVAEKNGVEMLVADLAPVRVILLTALASIADCEKYPGLAHALNTDFPARVAGACAKLGARLVHVSTDLVFGATPPPERGFSERDTPAPLSNYGRTKLAGERAVLAALPGALVVRLPLCWDEDGRGAGASTPLVSAVRAGEKPGLFTDEWRTPLFAADAGELLVRCAALDASGLLHVAGAERITRYDLGLSLLVARGFAPGDARAHVRALTRADAGLEALRPADVCLEATLAREQHGLAPRGVSACLRALASAQVPA